MTASGWKTLAVTGGFGCGKSEVGRRLEARGVPVLDTDRVAHALLRSDRPVGRSVIRAFGPGIVGSDGEIDRARLSAIVFSDERARARLHRLIHPAVRREVVRWLRAQRRRVPVAAVLVPLLFEAGMERGWSMVACVSARRDIVLARLARRGWTRADALGRMRAQWPLREKKKRSDMVIDNNGTLSGLDRSVDRLLERLMKKENAHHA